MLFVFFFIVIAPIISKKHRDWVLSQAEMYCYNNFILGVTNPAYIVDKRSIKELIEYYNIQEKDPKATPYITFGIKTLPQYDPVYVLKYSEDSLAAKVVSFYDRGRYGGSYNTGWVDTRTLHKEKPPK